MKKKQVAVSGMELRCQQGALVIVLGLLASTLLAREPVLFLNHWFTFQAQEEAPMNMLLAGPSELSSALHWSCLAVNLLVLPCSYHKKPERGTFLSYFF